MIIRCAYLMAFHTMHLQHLEKHILQVDYDTGMLKQVSLWCCSHISSTMQNGLIHIVAEGSIVVLVMHDPFTKSSSD